VSLPVIAETELRFVYSRSSGPGGQHVNRVETRATLLFDVAASPSLTEEQKRRIRRRLATRVNREGMLRVVSQRHRTREANRRAAIERFRELLTEALRTQRPRRKTSVPKKAKRRRVETKRRRGEIKRLRGKRGSSED
jgi:ribosome-associated protein